jgi:hypothetical protein
MTVSQSGDTELYSIVYGAFHKAYFMLTELNPHYFY